MSVKIKEAVCTHVNNRWWWLSQRLLEGFICTKNPDSMKSQAELHSTILPILFNDFPRGAFLPFCFLSLSFLFFSLYFLLLTILHSLLLFFRFFSFLSSPLVVPPLEPPSIHLPSVLTAHFQRSGIPSLRLCVLKYCIITFKCIIIVADKSLYV